MEKTQIDHKNTMKKGKKGEGLKIESSSGGILVVGGTIIVAAIGAAFVAHRARYSRKDKGRGKKQDETQRLLDLGKEEFAFGNSIEIQEIESKKSSIDLEVMESNANGHNVVTDDFSFWSDKVNTSQMETEQYLRKLEIVHATEESELDNGEDKKSTIDTKVRNKEELEISEPVEDIIGSKGEEENTSLLQDFAPSMHCIKQPNGQAFVYSSEAEKEITCNDSKRVIKILENQNTCKNFQMLVEMKESQPEVNNGAEEAKEGEEEIEFQVEDVGERAEEEPEGPRNSYDESNGEAAKPADIIKEEKMNGSMTTSEIIHQFETIRKIEDIDGLKEGGANYNDYPIQDSLSDRVKSNTPIKETGENSEGSKFADIEEEQEQGLIEEKEDERGTSDIANTEVEVLKEEGKEKGGEDIVHIETEEEKGVDSVANIEVEAVKEMVDEDIGEDGITDIEKVEIEEEEKDEANTRNGQLTFDGSEATKVNACNNFEDTEALVEMKESQYESNPDVEGSMIEESSCIRSEESRSYDKAEHEKTEVLGEKNINYDGVEFKMPKNETGENLEDLKTGSTKAAAGEGKEDDGVAYIEVEIVEEEKEVKRNGIAHLEVEVAEEEEMEERGDEIMPIEVVEEEIKAKREDIAHTEAGEENGGITNIEIEAAKKVEVEEKGEGMTHIGDYIAEEIDKVSKEGDGTAYIESDKETKEGDGASYLEAEGELKGRDDTTCVEADESEESENDTCMEIEEKSKVGDDTTCIEVEQELKGDSYPHIEVVEEKGGDDTIHIEAEAADKLEEVKGGDRIHHIEVQASEVAIEENGDDNAHAEKEGDEGGDTITHAEVEESEEERGGKDIVHVAVEESEEERGGKDIVHVEVEEEEKGEDEIAHIEEDVIAHIEREEEEGDDIADIEVDGVEEEGEDEEKGGDGITRIEVEEVESEEKGGYAIAHIEVEKEEKEGDDTADIEVEVEEEKERDETTHLEKEKGDGIEEVKSLDDEKMSHIKEDSKSEESIGTRNSCTRFDREGVCPDEAVDSEIELVPTAEMNPDPEIPEKINEMVVVVHSEEDVNVNGVENQSFLASNDRNREIAADNPVAIQEKPYMNSEMVMEVAESLPMDNIDHCDDAMKECTYSDKISNFSQYQKKQDLEELDTSQAKEVVVSSEESQKPEVESYIEEASERPKVAEDEKELPLIENEMKMTSDLTQKTSDWLELERNVLKKESEIIVTEKEKKIDLLTWHSKGLFLLMLAFTIAVALLAFAPNHRLQDYDHRLRKIFRQLNQFLFPSYNGDIGEL